MGGATVEMMSGEDLPSQVKAIIADCGYSSIEEELAYLLKRQFHLPKYPFVPTNDINCHRMGYYLSDVSSVEQLKHTIYRSSLFTVTRMSSQVGCSKKIIRPLRAPSRCGRFPTPLTPRVFGSILPSINDMLQPF